MKLLLVNQFFWPDVAATAQLLSDLASTAAGEGWRVSVVAGRGSYEKGFVAGLPARERWRGVRIRRVRCTGFGRIFVAGRVLDYATFFLFAAITAFFGRRQEIVVCLSTPPLVALLGPLLQLRGTKFLYKVEDLYPDVAVALGVFGERSPAALFFAALTKFTLRRADLCVALDEAMRERLLERGARRVEVIPNWADGEAIRPAAEAGRRFRREEGLGEGLVVLYSGNLGLAHLFDAVAETARSLDAESAGVTFLFVGGGPRLGEVRRATEGLGNVRFLPYQPRPRLHDLYNAADVHLVTLRDEVAGLSTPSKYPAALAAGKPVLLVGGAGTRMCGEIEAEGLGWTCRPTAEDVRGALREALADPEALAGMGRRAREVFDRRYSRKLATARWIRLLREVGGES